MVLCLFEDDRVYSLFPLTRTRASYDLRLGIRTQVEALRETFGTPRTILQARPEVAGVMAEEHDLLTNRLPEGLNVLFVNGRYVPEAGPVLERLRRAPDDGAARAFVQDGALVAAFVPEAASDRLAADTLSPAAFDDLPQEELGGEARLIGRLWHLLDAIGPAIARDFKARTKGYNILDHEHARIHDGARLIEPDRIYLGPGATVYPGAVLNAEDGPIYIGEGATVMEHAVVRGPAYLGAKGQFKVGANISQGAFGPWCKVGGEVHDTVIHSLSNKAHPGFLGHAYLGRWCNLGADTNNSNLRNDYGPVSLYNAATGEMEDTGRQFCGLFMGDHSKCGINTMFNTGTVVDVFCNLYGTGFPPRYLPPFSWGSPEDGFAPYRLEKALRVAEAVMARRDRTLTDAHRALLTAVAETQQEKAPDRSGAQGG